MIFITILLFIILTTLAAFAGRAHGVGKEAGWPSWARVASVIYMSALFGITNYYLFGILWLAPLAAFLTGWAFSTGHGRVYVMKGANLTDPNPEKLETLFGWIWQGPIDRPAYSWFIMGLKGLIMGLGIIPFGLLLYIIWPACYSWSFKKYNDSAPAEWASCGFAGLICAGIISAKILGA